MRPSTLAGAEITRAHTAPVCFEAVERARIVVEALGQELQLLPLHHRIAVPRGVQLRRAAGNAWHGRPRRARSPGGRSRRGRTRRRGAACWHARNRRRPGCNRARCARPAADPHTAADRRRACAACTPDGWRARRRNKCPGSFRMRGVNLLPGKRLHFVRQRHGILAFEILLRLAVDEAIDRPRRRESGRAPSGPSGRRRAWAWRTVNSNLYQSVEAARVAGVRRVCREAACTLVVARCEHRLAERNRHCVLPAPRRRALDQPRTRPSVHVEHIVPGQRASDAPPPSPHPPSGRGTACSSPRLPRAASWMPGRRSPAELRRPRVRPGQGRSARSVNRAGCTGCWDRARRAARAAPRPVRGVAPSWSGRPCPRRSGKPCPRQRKGAVPGSQTGSWQCGTLPRTATHPAKQNSEASTKSFWVPCRILVRPFVYVVKAGQTVACDTHPGTRRLE